MPMSDNNSAKPDVQTPNVEGLRGEKRDELGNDARTAPKMSGGAAAEANPLDATPDLRDAGKPESACGTEEPRTGR